MSKTIRRNGSTNYHGFHGESGRCNFDYCMHYDEERRRCSLRNCFYDHKYADHELDYLYRKRKREVNKWPLG